LVKYNIERECKFEIAEREKFVKVVSVTEAERQPERAIAPTPSSKRLWSISILVELVKSPARVFLVKVVSKILIVLS